MLQNSGLISGGTAAYAPIGGDSLASDLITNTGQIIGDILLSGGDDAYNGALGRLTGTVFGGDGVDIITGGIDNDIFFGDAGNDILTGGLGTDSLTGGAARDIFDFNSAQESVKGLNRDVIEDFVSGDNVTGDDIDLSTIDAKKAPAIRPLISSALMPSRITRASCASSRSEARATRSCRATSTATARPISTLSSSGLINADQGDFVL